MNPYEITFIVRPDRDEDETRAAVQTVTGRIETVGGEVLATAPWNPPRRRMAYPIREFGDGYYVTTVFRMNADGVRTLETALKLNENVLRYLVIRATDTQVEQVQQRAQAAYLAASQPPPQPPVQAPIGDEAVEQPAPAITESAQPGSTVDAVQPAAAGAASPATEE